MTKHDVSTGLYLVAMVGIVAVIGLVVLVMSSGGSSMSLGTEDITGQAIGGHSQQLQNMQTVTQGDLEEFGDELRDELYEDFLVSIPDSFMVQYSYSPSSCSQTCNSIGMGCWFGLFEEGDRTLLASCEGTIQSNYIMCMCAY